MLLTYLFYLKSSFMFKFLYFMQVFYLIFLDLQFMYFL